MLAVDVHHLRDGLKSFCHLTALNVADLSDLFLDHVHDTEGHLTQLLISEVRLPSFLAVLAEPNERWGKSLRKGFSPVQQLPRPRKLHVPCHGAHSGHRIWSSSSPAHLSRSRERGLRTAATINNIIPTTIVRSHGRGRSEVHRTVRHSRTSTSTCLGFLQLLEK